MNCFESDTEKITIRCDLCGRSIEDLRHGIAFWPKDHKDRLKVVHDCCEGGEVGFFPSNFDRDNDWVRLHQFFEEIAHQMIIFLEPAVDLKYLSYATSFNSHRKVDHNLD